MQAAIRNGQSFSIALLSIIFLGIGLKLDMIPYHHNMLVLILVYMIFLEMSKLIIEMIIQPDAPIKIRYILAGLIIASSREFYIALIEKDKEMAAIAMAALAILLVLRHYAIYSTKEGR